MKLIPLLTKPSQTLQITLAEQDCTINLYQKSTGVYFDLYVSNNPICLGVICHDRNKLVRQSYLGFIGDFCMVDLEGTEDPDYSGFGSRYVLIYLEASEL